MKKFRKICITFLNFQNQNLKTYPNNKNYVEKLDH